MADAPLGFQLHALVAFGLFALWPFTRLVHVFSAPLGYLTRPYIVYRCRDDASSAATGPAAGGTASPSERRRSGREGRPVAGGAGVRRTGALVRDVMLRRPKTMPAEASVEEARAALANDHVHLVLLTDGSTLVGTLARTDLPPGAPGSGPALPWSTLRDRTVPATAPADAVPAILAARGLRRLAVVDDDGTLLGLICLKRRRTGFCSDRDVESRARARADSVAQASSGASRCADPGSDTALESDTGPESGSTSARSPMSARRSRSETS